MMSSLQKIFARSRIRFLRRLWPWALGIACLCLILTTHLSPGHAQSSEDVESQEDAVIQQFSLPKPAPQAPVVQPRRQAPAARPAAPAARPAARPAAPAQSRPPARPAQTAPDPQPEAPAQAPAADSEATVAATNDGAADEETSIPQLSTYILQFNRSPVVGNALQLEGILSQARLGFTRPQNWQVESAKLKIRFRHSPALYAERSNLTVRLNNVHLGSVPLNREAGEIGNILFEVPADTLQNYNTVVMDVQQHTSPDCTDPTDPALWTEILPDSQVIINYRPQAIALDLASFPFPFLNELGLDADRLAYLEPQSPDDGWTTAAARFQAAAARLTNFRSIETRIVQSVDELEPGEKLVVLGTPATQPGLSELELPFAIQNNRVLDGGDNALPNDVGVVMVTTTEDGSYPVLVVTGNESTGVLKAVQALSQTSDRQILTGQAALISEVSTVESPQPDNWQGFLPQDTNRFQLADLETSIREPFTDVTVNGLPVPPPVQIPFRSLPDDQFLQGSTFTLRYSYSPNVDPARSSVAVAIDGQALGGERLRKTNGGSDSITVNIPPGLVKPTSNLEVQFFTYPRTAISCGDIPDQPMWGTVHGNSNFKLNRANVVELPNLQQLQVGYPLTAPQDLTQMAFVLPERPTNEELLTMLQASSRFGRLSRADTVKLEAYSGATLPDNVRRSSHLIAIGTQGRFPLTELSEGQNGFALGEQFARRQNRSQVQTLPDEAGVIHAALSPWNRERIVLGLTGQAENGLIDVQQVLYRDDLFSQLRGDTLLVQRTVETPSPFSTEDYLINTLTQENPEIIDRRGFLTQITSALQANWFLIPGGIILIVLVLYGVSQLYLNRASHSEGA